MRHMGLLKVVEMRNESENIKKTASNEEENSQVGRKTFAVEHLMRAREIEEVMHKVVATMKIKENCAK